MIHLRNLGEDVLAVLNRLSEKVKNLEVKVLGGDKDDEVKVSKKRGRKAVAGVVAVMVLFSISNAYALIKDRNIDASSGIQLSKIDLSYAPENSAYPNGNLYLQLPTVATASLPSAASANKGSIVYDITTSSLKYSDGSSWSNVGKVGSTNLLYFANANTQDVNIIFEGATADAFETTITVTDPTADNTVTIPDATGTVLLDSDIYNHSLSGVKPLVLEGATADAFETVISVTDPTADRTVTLPDADVDLGDVGIVVITLTHEGAETATLSNVFTFQMPFAATLVEVSATARVIDTGDADETYTIDLKEAGATVLTAPIAITASNSPVLGAISDTSIADNAKMTVDLTIGGTTPSITGITLLIEFKK